MQHGKRWGWLAGGVAAVVLASAAASGGSVTAQQPAPTPTPVLVGMLGTPSSLPWQLVDPAFEPLPGAQGYFGVLDRAAFRIELPDNWNGELLMYAHGYAGEQPLLRAPFPPIREHLIAQGFAWAASSYQENGYDPDLGVTNTLDLRDYFIKNFGMPARSYLMGTSMGGHIVVASLEQHAGVYDGAFAECGVLMQEQEIDYLAASAALADYISGVNALPVADADAYAALIKTQTGPALGLPNNDTAKGRAYESAITYLTGGPRPFRHQGMVDFLALASGAITRQTPSSLAALAVTNDYFDFHIAPGLGFTDQELNANVLRVYADPTFRNPDTNPTFALPTGRITVPLITYHTTGDNFVPVLHEIGYRNTVDAAGAGPLLVQRGVRAPDHCQFDVADRVQGFDDLVNWVENGVKPEGDNFLAPDLTDLGSRWTHKLLPGNTEGY